MAYQTGGGYYGSGGGDWGFSAYPSMSAYNSSSPYYNKSAFGNQGFFVPSGNTGQQNSPIGMALQNYGSNQMSPYGGYASNYNYPANQMGVPTVSGQYGGYGMNPYGMDPTYFQYWAQSALSGQQQQQRQASVADALARLKPTLESLGVPTSSADVSKSIEQQLGLESAPIMQSLGEVEREINQDIGRRGASLGSERQRQLSEVRGAAAGALRQRQVGAPLEYAIRLLQSVPGLVKGLGG